MKKIGILGSGVVGKALARGFHKHGYHIMIATHQEGKLADFISEFKDRLQVGSFRETARFGEIQVLAVKGVAAKKVVEDLGNDLLGGKTVMDATNPISEAPPEHGVLHYFSEINHSLMEDLQEAVDTARFVKAFNCIGSAHMVDPQFEAKPSMFICGDHEGAKGEVKSIVELFGFECLDMGKKEAARAIEPLAMLWCIPGFSNNNWNHAFRMMQGG
jgi:predicted dinucleotide-binding enzyme